MFDETIVEVKPQTKPNREKTINVEVDVDTKERKYRMYCFVERHLSPIDKGIQAAHSIVEYSKEYGNYPSYYRWANYDKTIILLNGGNINDLDDICKELNEWKIKYTLFKEEDLGGIVTSVAVLVDDRVFDEEYYHYEIEEREESGFDLTEEEYQICVLRELIKSKHLAR